MATFVVDEETRIDLPSGSVSTEDAHMHGACLIDGGSWWCSVRSGRLARNTFEFLYTITGPLP